MKQIPSLIESNVEEYLKQHEKKDLLRFITCGSVDDGKSTLIGRLLHDSKVVLEDQMSAIEKESREILREGKVDFSLLVDGLQAEREQGITIDVAYRYFNTEKRKFIIADTPGHEQYTRNMVTGASTSDLAIILIDARHGVQTQTKRHSFIVSLLGIKHIIVAVNKMDLVGFSQKRYKEIQSEYLTLAGQLDVEEIHFVPISALDGDNVVQNSSKTEWFKGKTLIQYLETINVHKIKKGASFRLPVQYVNRPNSEFRGYSGTVVSGSIDIGDTVRVLPSGKVSKIKEIVTFDESLVKANFPQAITLRLTDELDISRGDVITNKDQLPHTSSRLRAKVVWMSETKLRPNIEFYFKVGCKTTTGYCEKIVNCIDINSFDEKPGTQLSLNEIGTLDFCLHEPVVFDKYRENPGMGAFIIIDRLTNETVAAGMIEQPLTDTDGGLRHVSEFEKDLNYFVRKHFPHWNAKDITKD